MRAIICIVALVAVVQAQELTITNAEYFWDVDPGVGSGTTLALTPSDAPYVAAGVDLSTLSVGEHTLYVRYQCSNAEWSAAEGNRVYISPSLANDDQELTAAEYFWDTDPGVGNGVSWTVQTGDIVELKRAVTPSLSEGNHVLYVRYQADNGTWSAADGNRVYISPPLRPVDNVIAGGEFFFDAPGACGTGAGMYADDGAFDETTESMYRYWLAQNLTQGIHPVYMRVRDASGQWSSLVADTVVITGLSDTSGVYLELVSPNGGEQLSAGTQFSISWTSHNVPGTALIELNRTYSACDWEYVGTVDVNSGSITWTVTGPETPAARIRITSLEWPAIGDTSEAEFTIGNFSGDLEFVGSYDTPSRAYGLFVSGDYAYVADHYSGFQIINISDPHNPTSSGSYGTPDVTIDVFVSGNYAYVTAYTWGLMIFNVSNPENLTWVGHHDTPELGMDVFVIGTLAYVADAYAGLQIVTVSDPTHPVLISGRDTPETARGIWVANNYAYIADWESGLQIFNVADSLNPYWIGSYDTPDRAQAVHVAGNYAYVASGTAGLYIIDVSNPQNPSLAANLSLPGTALSVFVAGYYAYIGNEPSGLYAIDVSDPYNPTLDEFHNTPDRVCGIFVSGNYIYAAVDYAGLEILRRSTQCAVITPNGGEDWIVGETRTISWASQNVNGNVDIEFDRNYPSGVWESIVSDVSNTGCYNWTVTGPSTEHARVRVIGVSEQTVGDTSNADFTIQLLGAPVVVIRTETPLVLLHWMQVAGDALDYNVYRDSLITGAFDYLIGTTSDTVFVDSTSLGGSADRWFYQVRAVR